MTGAAGYSRGGGSASFAAQLRLPGASGLQLTEKSHGTWGHAGNSHDTWGQARKPHGTWSHAKKPMVLTAMPRNPIVHDNMIKYSIVAGAMPRNPWYSGPCQETHLVHDYTIKY